MTFQPFCHKGRNAIKNNYTVTIFCDFVANWTKFGKQQGADFINKWNKVETL